MVKKMVDQTALLSDTRHFERLLEISRTLGSTLDLPILLQEIIEVACELTDSESASILLYNEREAELRFEAFPDSHNTDLGEISVPLDSSVAGWIFRNNQPLVIQDASTDSRVYRQVDQKIDFETRSILGVPLTVKEKPIGVIESVNKLDGKNFTDEDLSVLETLAGQAAVALENAKLLVQLQDANADLLRLDRMKSDFIAIASHELRTPLGLILGHATYLKDLVPDEFQEQIDTIVRSAMRLKDLIEDLSTIAHKEAGDSRVRSEPFSMSDLAQHVAARYQAEAESKQIDLGSDVPDDPLMVEGDREKIDLVLTNLIQNAIIYTDPGGQIGVKAEASSGYVKVFVVDDGVGIPSDESDRIFERFYQVETHLTRKHGGMGLGLSIAKAMVELHNGQIWCESKEDVGSLFCFMLPMNKETAAAAAKVFTSG